MFLSLLGCRLVGFFLLYHNLSPLLCLFDLSQGLLFLGLEDCNPCVKLFDICFPIHSHLTGLCHRISSQDAGLDRAIPEAGVLRHQVISIVRVVHQRIHRVLVIIEALEWLEVRLHVVLLKSLRLGHT